MKGDQGERAFELLQVLGNVSQTPMITVCIAINFAMGRSANMDFSSLRTGDTLQPHKFTSKNLSYGNNQGSILPGHPHSSLQQGCSSQEKTERQPTERDWVN